MVPLKSKTDLRGTLFFLNSFIFLFNFLFSLMKPGIIFPTG